MDTRSDTSQSLATAITKSASQQTYYTIRLCVDRNLVTQAFMAYGYFRWVDDVIDTQESSRADKVAFVNRQQALLEASYRGEMPGDLCVEERILIELVQSDTQPNSGLQTYLRNMMAVMAFDANRRGQIITQAELSNYTLNLASAVTEAMHYFIGHNDPSPRGESRYLAVAAAHITHMLRDTVEDAQAGYFNIPHEVLKERNITPHNVESRVYREWVCSRIKLARRYFKAGREYLAQVKNLRCRLAGYAYTARFEWMLRTIERDNYCLRAQYPERKGWVASLWMGWAVLVSLLKSPGVKTIQPDLGITPKN